MILCKEIFLILFSPFAQDHNSCTEDKDGYMPFIIPSKGYAMKRKDQSQCNSV